MNAMESDPLFSCCLELSRSMARQGLSGYGMEMGQPVTGLMQPGPPALSGIPPRVRELAGKICSRPRAHEAIAALSALRGEDGTHAGE